MGVLETGRVRDGTLEELEAWAVCSHDVFGPLSLMDPLSHVRSVYLPFQFIFFGVLKRFSHSIQVARLVNRIRLRHVSNDLSSA
jgi:hypothetical protein